MAVTVVLGADAERVRPVVSPLAELSAGLHVLTAPDHHGALDRWSTRILETFTDQMVGELQAFGFLWDHFRAEFMMPSDPGAHDTLEGELSRLSTMPTDEFLQLALRPLGEHPGEPLHVDAESDSDQLLAHARARNRRAEAVTASLITSPEVVRERLVAFLDTCRRRFFDDEWERMLPTLRRAAADVRHLRDTRGPRAMLTGLAHGIRLQAGDVVIDKAMDTTLVLGDDRPLWVVPSLLSHPHLYVQFDPDWPAMVQYAVQRRAPGRPLPSMEVTAEQLHALADPSRLELCTLIAREARATQELANLSGLSAPTVSRHVKVLREAGIVTSHQRGHFKLHALDLDVVESIGHALVASMLR